jgi:hypothetical protein
MLKTSILTLRKNAMYRPISVKAFWDDEAKVWVAESDDVAGLATYGNDIPHLIEKLNVMIPELLEANGEIGADDIPYQLISQVSAIAHRTH